jgi:hypothetical protein
MSIKDGGGSGVFKNFIIGGVAGMSATSVVQPVDMIKVRIQLSSADGGSTNPFVVAREIK